MTEPNLLSEKKKKTFPPPQTDQSQGVNRNPSHPNQRPHQAQQQLHDRVPASETHADRQVREGWCAPAARGAQDGGDDLQDLDGRGDFWKQVLRVRDARDARDVRDSGESRRTWQ
ncbi:MAG: hypothetical protein Q9210_005544 [Variospora velana]